MSPRTRRTPWTWLALVALFVAPATARADDASEAQLQFELGTELYRQHRYAEAVDRFIASNRLVPNANVVFNVAQTFALMNRPIEAFNWYETYLGFDGLAPAARARAEAARDRLTARVAVLDVATEPRGVEIFIDRVELGAVGRAPRRLAVAPGEHTVIARLPYYRSAEARVQAAARATTPVALTLAPVLGTLAVTTDPPGATVRLEATRVVLGTTPLSAPVPVGDATVRVSLPGFVDQTRTVQVRDGETARLEVPLERAASTVAVLTVRSDPPGATVLLDGHVVGRAPLSIAGVRPGSARLELRMPGREPWAEAVVFEPGGATRVRARLVDPRARAWPGWRWLGYGAGGAVLAGGAATGGVAVYERAAFFANPSAGALATVNTLNPVADALMLGGLVVLGATVVIDLVSGPRLASHGTVTVAR